MLNFKMKNKYLVFIGDSLTEFFDWQERFPDYLVLNLGIAGETVEGVLGRMDKILLSIRNTGRNPDFIFIMTGINNLAMEDYEILSSYRRIVNILSASLSNSKLVIQSILPVALPWVDNSVLQGLNNSLMETAQDFKADYLDLHSLFMYQDSVVKKDFLLNDGVHLSEKGYAAWSDVIENYLKDFRA